MERARRELVGKSYYTRFALRGKRYEPVTITGVEPGTWEAALRLHLRSKEVRETTVDVNGCGTNVLSSHRTAYRLDNFLTEPATPAGLGTVSPESWDAIRTGNVLPGMTPAQVEEALGKPQKIIKLISANKKRLEYVYDDQHLLFEDGRLVLKPY